MPAKNQWIVLKIRSMAGGKVYDDYTQASKSAEKARYESDISSSDRDELTISASSSKGRILKRNTKYDSSDDGTETDKSGSSIKSLPIMAQRPSHEVNSPHTIKGPSEGGYSDILHVQKEVSSKCTEHEAILQKLCSRVSYLTMLLKQVATDISDLKTMHMDTRNFAEVKTSTVDWEHEDLYQFPIGAIAELEEFDNTLMDKDKYLKMVQFMASIGGTNTYNFVKRVMSRIITEELAAHFSFTGNKGKQKLGGFFIIKALKDSAKKVKTLNSSTETEVEQKIKDWLRHAPSRVSKLKANENAAVNIINK